MPCSRSAARTISCACWRASRRCRRSSAPRTARTCWPPTAAPPTSCAPRRRRTDAAATIAGAPDAALLEQAEEKAVAAALADVERRGRRRRSQREDFAGAMAAFAGLRAPVDAFFDKVTVNVAEKPRLATEPAAACSTRSAPPWTRWRISRRSRARERAMAKWVYSFGGGKAEGRADMSNLLGGKGANLAEMASLGLPVPPGFTITTEVCTYYYDNGQQLSGRAEGRGRGGAGRRSRRSIGTKFGDAAQPAAGLGPLRRARLDAGHDGHGPQPRPQRRDRARASAKRRATSASPTTATAASSRCTATSCSASSTTSSRRSLEHQEGGHGVQLDTELTADDWQRAGRRATRRWSRSAPASRSRRTRASSSGAPSAPCSARWKNQRAITYRRLQRHPRRAGAPRSTCRRWCSATWATTAPPASPSPATRRPARTCFYGEYLVNAQGEDVVAGIRTPQPIDRARQASAEADAAGDGRGACPRSTSSSATIRAQAREALPRHAGHRVHHRSSGKLYMLQTRNGKRTAAAALQDRRRHGERGADRREGGGDARRARPRSTSCCTRRSIPRPSAR